MIKVRSKLRFVAVALLAAMTACASEPPAAPKAEDAGDVQPAVLIWPWGGPNVTAIDGQPIDGQKHSAKLDPGTHKIEFSFPIAGTQAQLSLRFWAEAGHKYQLVVDARDGRLFANVRDITARRIARDRELEHNTWRSVCRRAVDGDGQQRSAIAKHYRHGWPPFSQDLVQAYKWYSLAVQAGYRAASDQRRSLAAAMAEEDVYRGSRLANAWQPDVNACVNEALPAP